MLAFREKVLAYVKTIPKGSVVTFVKLFSHPPCIGLR